MCQRVDTEQTEGPFVAEFMTLVFGMYVKECVCVWGKNSAFLYGHIEDLYKLGQFTVDLSLKKCYSLGSSLKLHIQKIRVRAERLLNSFYKSLRTHRIGDMTWFLSLCREKVFSQSLISSTFFFYFFFAYLSHLNISDNQTY